MTTNDPATQLSLSDVLHEFAMSEGPPSAALLDEFTRRHPQHATELTAFALEWALDPDRWEAAKTPEPAPVTSPAVMRAMSRFQNKLFEVRAAAKASPRVAVENPFSKLDRRTLRTLAGQLGVTPIFVVRMRDRTIKPETIPDTFRRRTATQMNVPDDLLVAHFRGQPEIQQGTRHKADGKPKAVAQQTFEEAARASGLTDEQLKKLLGS